jgi:hypothetical protein
MAYKIPKIFEPQSVIRLQDDFFAVNITGTTSLISELGWFNVGSRMDTLTTTSNAHPGIVSNNSAASGNDYGIFASGNQVGGAINPSIILGGGALSINWVISVAILADVTNDYILRVGLGDTATTDQANGCYFEYNYAVNSGNWICKTANAGSRTTTNSAIAASSWVNLGININAGATSVVFLINGVVVQTHVADIPTAAVTPMVYVETTAGTTAADSTLVDLFYMTQVLTTSR